jgi:hypothetical protein
MGLYPNPFLSRMEKSVQATLARIEQSSVVSTASVATTSTPSKEH